MNTIDSNVRNPDEDEYDEQNSLQHQLLLLWTDLYTMAIGGKSQFEFFGQTGFPMS